MIITRAPLRISFVGGGTDFADFYQHYPGKVISTAIDKYVYVVVNKTPLMKKVSVRYSIGEVVNHPSELKNDRVRAILLDMGIYNNIEIGTFSQLPGETGLGSSSSFSVALIKGLYTSFDRKINRKETAEAACRLEVDLLKEPIGKQDQYASALGGFNILQFNSDGSVDVEPILIDYKKRLDLEKHMLIFYTGVQRPASSVLVEQKLNINKKKEQLKEMANLVPVFKKNLIEGNFKNLGEILHQNWLKKKSLASNVSNSLIDELYQGGMDSGAFGGKILGAGGGGCILFLTSPDKKDDIREAVKNIFKKNNINDCVEVPVKIAQSGVEIIVNTENN
jgi:D-glycero-alpha-D-manno-heptose-7-phosphate kinase